MASVLVVDDARSTLRALEAILGREGYTVLTATSGDEALTHLAHHAVELLHVRRAHAYHGWFDGAAARQSPRSCHGGGHDVGAERCPHRRGSDARRGRGLLGQAPRPGGRAQHSAEGLDPAGAARGASASKTPGA